MTSQPRHERHIVRTETQDVQKASGRGLGGKLRPGAVLDAYLVALDVAVELRRRTAQRVETESTGERLRSGFRSREFRTRHGDLRLAPDVRPRERVQSFRIRHDALVVPRVPGTFC